MIHIKVIQILTENGSAANNKPITNEFAPRFSTLCGKNGIGNAVDNPFLYYLLKI